MKRQFSTALALSLAAVIQLGAADLYVASGASETASCASKETACDFQTALDKAQENLHDDMIHVASGDYTISSMLTYESWADGKGALSIQGAGAASTKLDGGGSDCIMSIYAHALDGSDDITIRGISFSNGVVIRGGCGGYGGGGLHVHASLADITIENSTFSENSSLLIGSMSGYGGGAYIESWEGNVILTNNIFSNNTASYWGGGAYVHTTSGIITCTNNTFSGNTVPSGCGGGAYISLAVDSAKAELFNNIIWGNMARDGGDDLYVKSDGSSTVILNNNNLGLNADFESGQSADLYITNTDNYYKDGNLQVDPQFLDVSGGNFHLLATSQLIDEGFMCSLPLPKIDFEGDKRVIVGNGDDIAIPDIGADEYNPPVKQADDIVEFIESGVLVGAGPGNSGDSRIDAMNNMIEIAKKMIEKGNTTAACKQLQSAYLLTDGDPTPPDAVEAGNDADELADMIQNLMDSIGCPIQ